MDIEPPSADYFDRNDLSLSPKLHHEQAKMAAERGEEYDPYEYEERVTEINDGIDPIEDAEAVEGKENLLTEWQTGE